MQIWVKVLFQKRREVQTSAQTWNQINFTLYFWKQFMWLETHRVCIYGEWPPHQGLQFHLLLLKATNRITIADLVHVFKTASCQEIKAQLESRWLY